jgi:hypothetical protein
MQGMDAAILGLLRKGQITKETVLAYAETPELIERKMKELANLKDMSAAKAAKETESDEL